MKYVHTIINNAVTNPFIDLINNNFNPDDHTFYIIRGWNQSLVEPKKSDNVYVINNVRNVLNGFKLLYDLAFSRKIFIHGLFSPYLVGMLFVQPWLLKKCHWVIWGGDLHVYKERNKSISSGITEFMRASVIRNFGNIITSIAGDYELAKKWYNVKGTRMSATYPLILDLKKIDELRKSYSNDSQQAPFKQTRIIIGNSANDENKLTGIIEYLKKFKNENLIIHANLSYGEKEYSDYICELGLKEFGDKFIGITKFMPINDYIHFIDSMNILIFNHERQQGLGNLLTALYLGKKIYINPKSPLWDMFIEFKIIVNSIANIEKESFEEFRHHDIKVADINKMMVEKMLSNGNVVLQWDHLFNKSTC